MKVADTLCRFANARERAFRSAGKLTLTKAEAIAKIKRIASMYRDKPTTQQYHAVRMVSDELFLIAPAPESRFKKMRDNIHQLISHAYGPHASQVRTSD